MNDLCLGLGVIVCLYHQQQLGMKNMYLTSLPFCDLSLRKCHYGEELMFRSVLERIYFINYNVNIL